MIYCVKSSHSDNHHVLRDCERVCVCVCMLPSIKLDVPCCIYYCCTLSPALYTVAVNVESLILNHVICVEKVFTLRVHRKSWH